MPLTEKGEKIKKAMTEQYGKERGEEVFWASKNKGTISGVDSMKDNMTSSSLGTSGMSSTAGSSGIITDTDDDEAPLILDADLGPPERRDEIVGDIPKEQASEPKDKSTLPDVKEPARTMSASLVPLSIPVGDQSLSNMNSRNRNFWRR